MSRRLITYLLIDTSGSMRGEPIEAVNSGLRALLASLRANPYALDSVYLSITTFDLEVKEVLPLTQLSDVILPEICCPDSGATFLGAGLEQICAHALRDVHKSSAISKGDWKPMLVILTDGKPTDTMAFSEVIPHIKACDFATIVACAAGPRADSTSLKQLTEHVVSLDTMDAASFAKFFAWVSVACAKDSQSRGAGTQMDLPPPPPEINIVI